MVKKGAIRRTAKISPASAGGLERAVTPKDALELKLPAGSDEEKALAEVALQPNLHAAMTIRQLSQVGNELDLTKLTEVLREQAKIASTGELGRLEAMLTSQAHTLDALFHSLVRRSVANMGTYTDAADRYMRLALRAQSQCRAAAETLALIKNPPSVAFVKQANIAGGHQQVNNGVARARESRDERNELLLEVKDGQRLEPGATGKTSAIDSPMEALEAIDRAQNTTR